MEFLSTLEPQVFLYILSSISEGLNALGELFNIKRYITYTYYEINVLIIEVITIAEGIITEKLIHIIWYFRRRKVKFI
jgi:hypothetical protein